MTEWIDGLLARVEHHVVNAPFWSLGIAWFVGAVIGVAFS
jgi:hypothetical protein